MDELTALPDIDNNKLLEFHATHFPGQRPPDLQSSEASNKTNDNGLGHYHDGVKRNLTDEQIAMFRHSEIQRSLQRQRSAANEDVGEEKQQAALRSHTESTRRGSGSHTELRSKRTRRAYDEPSETATDVTLDYDGTGDIPLESASLKTFQWPKLG